MRQLGISLFLTTYQAGKLVIVRAHDGDHLNTHFRAFPARWAWLAGDRLALGAAARSGNSTTSRRPRASSRRSGGTTRVSCRSCHITGNVQVHEMAWAGDELWFVNTRFSCLCTLDRNHSFVARWRPPFVSRSISRRTAAT